MRRISSVRKAQWVEPETMSSDHAPQICLFGSPGDTSNLGVSALLEAVVSGLARRSRDLQLTVFDNGWGLRPASTLVDGRPFTYQLCGARLSRRFHRPESLRHMQVAARLGGMNNAGVKLVRSADAVLDVSGGDSFSDIYGPKRFRAIVLPKLITLQLRIPLVLLPQTYGPFSGVKTRRSAQSIVTQASMAWARDPNSFESLRALLGGAWSPDRHRSGVDMAFALQPRPPEGQEAESLRAWLSEDPGATATVGLNVSGLLFNDARAHARYGLHADYRAAVSTMLTRLLREGGARVLLVPHVGGQAMESDMPACVALLATLRPEERRRVAIAPQRLGPGEMKWTIAQLDWFCGTRMHATIAALSSGVPTSAIAYSPKTRGVFETCGQEHRVADARRLGTEQVLDLLWTSWCEREEGRVDLAGSLPRTLASAESQMDEIFRQCFPSAVVGDRSRP